MEVTNVYNLSENANHYALYKVATLIKLKTMHKFMEYTQYYLALL